MKPNDEEENPKKMLPIKVSFLLVFVALLGLNCDQEFQLIESGRNIGNDKSARIFSGRDAAKGQFKFYTQIKSTLAEQQVSYGVIRRVISHCGGSLIDNQHVLTAAHCVSNPSPIWIELTFGFYNISDTIGQLVRYSKCYETHSAYNPSTLVNDIAMITLNEPIGFTSIIQPIQMSSIYAKPNTSVQDAGRGITSDAATSIPPTLKYANLLTISNQECSKTFDGINFSNLCAAAANKEAACRGDSGSALIKTVNGIQIQIGLVSAGAAVSCERGYPNIFTRISIYLYWIKARASITWKLNV